MLKIRIVKSGAPVSLSFTRLGVVCFFSLGLAASLALPTNVMAQSGSRIAPQPSYRPAPTQARPPAGSQARSMAPQRTQTRPSVSPVALGGYCPVCIVSMKKWVKGSPEHQAVYDGKTYLFPDESVKKTFLSDPAKWVPAMGGDCTVCKVDMGQNVAGNLQFSSLYNDRLYLFPGEAQKRTFGQNPDKYANADVALDGKCSVCRVEMNKEVPGNPDFTSVYQGKRYWFPGLEQQSMFVSNPAKYAE